MRSSGTWLPPLGAALFAALLAVDAGTALAAEAPRYRIRNLGNVEGFDNVAALDLNARGDVVGLIRGFSMPQQPFLYRDGRIRTLPLPPGNWTGSAFGINDLGDVAGVASGDGGQLRPLVFRRDGSTINLLPSIQGRWDGGSVSDINNAGVSTGHVYGGGQDYTTFVHDGTRGHAVVIPGETRHTGFAVNAAGDVLIDDLNGGDFYLYSQGSVTKLPSLGAGPRPFTVYGSFNDAGQLTGWLSLAGGGTGSFIYDHGRVELIPGRDLQAGYINNRGWVVGSWYDKGGFLYRDGEVHGLQDLLRPDEARHWNLAVPGGGALALNDAGQIIGRGTYNGVPRSFIATPVAVPEASAPALLLAGLGVVGWATRARRRQDAAARSAMAPATAAARR